MKTSIKIASILVMVSLALIPNVAGNVSARGIGSVPKFRSLQRRGLDHHDGAEKESEDTIFSEHAKLRGKGSGSGKGSGKSSKSSKSPKSTKSGSEDSSGSSGSKSSKSSKSTKTGSSRQGGGTSVDTRTHPPTIHPTMAPTGSHATATSGQSKQGDSRPPTPVMTSPPVSSPSATNAPVGQPTTGGSTPAPSAPEPSKTITLDRYAVSYTLPSGLQTERGDFDELSVVTAAYLNQFMENAFASTTMANFLAITVVVVTTSVNANSIIVVYDSDADFTESSDDGFANANSLKSTLEGAFEGQSALDYVGVLQTDLPESNPFSRTISVANAAIVSPSSTNRSGSSKTSSATKGAIIAGASGIIILAAGIVLYRRGAAEDEEAEFGGKSLNKPRGMEGDHTVAGDTYAGETYTSGQSYMRDEEHGDMVNIDLGSTADAYDSSSVSPLWDDNETVAGPNSTTASVISDEDQLERVALNSKDADMIAHQMEDVADTTTATPDSSEFDANAYGTTNTAGDILQFIEAEEERIDESTHLSVDQFEEFLVSDEDFEEARPAFEKFLNNSQEDQTLENLLAEESEGEDADVQDEYDNAEQDDEFHDNNNDAEVDAGSAARRPLTVEEIESLLSEELADDMLSVDDSSSLAGISIVSDVTSLSKAC